MSVLVGLERLADVHCVADLLFFAVAAPPVVLGEHAETFADTIPPTAVPSLSPKPGLLAPLFALLTPQGNSLSLSLHCFASLLVRMANLLNDPHLALAHLSQLTRPTFLSMPMQPLTSSSSSSPHQHCPTSA